MSDKIFIEWWGFELSPHTLFNSFLAQFLQDPRSGPMAPHWKISQLLKCWEE